MKIGKAFDSEEEFDQFLKWGRCAREFWLRTMSAIGLAVLLVFFDVVSIMTAFWLVPAGLVWSYVIDWMITRAKKAMQRNVP